MKTTKAATYLVTVLFTTVLFTIVGCSRPGTGGRPITRIIACGSISGNNSCNAFGTVASVKLVRADDPRLCSRGSTWGYTMGGGDFWTKAGCKGDFLVTYTAVMQPR